MAHIETYMKSVTHKRCKWAGCKVQEVYWELTHRAISLRLKTDDQMSYR